MVTERIARFISDTPSSDIPEEARTIVRLAITDFFAVALAGLKDETGNIITQYVKDMGGVAQCGVIGSGFKVSPYLAALANGTLGHAMDFDDVSHNFWHGHPSVCLVPPLLSIGESIGASGADIITAYVIGFEAGACLHTELAEGQITRGWHGTSIIGTLGAVAVASRLLKLNVHQIRMALGIAASLASGLAQNGGTMTKPLHAGHAASNGVMAALLAQKGFTAHESIIEAPRGYAKMFGCEEEIDWENVGKELGRTFVIGIPAIEFKRYPNSTGTRLITAALYLRDRYKIDPNMITEIIFGISPSHMEKASKFPKTGLEAQFSITYSVCRALLDGRFTIDSLSDEQIRQPDVEHLMKLTKLVERYPESTRGREGKQSPQSITIKLKNGMEYSHETPIQAKPMTPKDIENKYRECASLVLNGKAVAKSVALLRNLEALENIRELMGIVAKT